MNDETTQRPMTVQNLIDILNGIENKSLPVYVKSTSGPSVFYQNFGSVQILEIDTEDDKVDIKI